MPSRKRYLAGVFLALLLACALRAYAAVVQLPGTWDTALGTYPNGDPRNGLHLVARDSNGYWYVVWENASQSDILMAYTTTSTPSATAHWTLLTLVDNAAGGVITATPANDTSGSYPSICMGLDDVLHFVWRAADTTGTCYYTQCSDAQNAATASNWIAPLRVSTDITDYSFALDYEGSPHLAGRGKNSLYVLYTKYDTASVAWLAEKELSTQMATYNTAAPDSVALAVDLDNNVWVAWRGSDAAAPTLTSSIYLLNSSSADDVAPASSGWQNLGLSSSTPDVTCTSCMAMAPQLVASSSGAISMGWKEGTQTTALLTTQFLGASLLATRTTLANSGSLFSLGGYTPGWSAIYLLYSTSGTARTFYESSTQTYRNRTITMSNAALQTSVSAQGFLSPSRLPRRLDNNFWFATNTTDQKIVSADTSISLQASNSLAWDIPRQNKGLPHPHLRWVWPNSRNALNTSGATNPIVAHASKSCIYTVDTSLGSYPFLYAVDVSTGVFIRSYSLVGMTTLQSTAATYSGNVHLYVAANSCWLLALIDDGATIALDPGWATNPLSVGNATGAQLHSLVFNQESGVRYLYMLASVDPVNIGINKINADTGAVATGFNVGIAYSPAGAIPRPSLLRIINDNVYVAGNTSQVYRRGADGSAEIFSSGITNTVRSLMLWRNSNDLYVSPAGNYVYRLTSGLLTNTWTSGQSASPGAVKTSGAQMNPEKTFLFMGVGNQLYKINVTDGSLMSNTPFATAANIVTAPYQWKSYVYFGDDLGMVYAVNASDPTVARANWPINISQFATSAAGKVKTQVIDAARNTLYVVTGGTVNRRVWAFSLE